MEYILDNINSIPDGWKIITALFPIIGFATPYIVNLLYNTPLDSVLTTKSHKIIEELIATFFIAIIFATMSVIGPFIDYPQPPRFILNAILLVFTISILMFLVLLFISAIISNKRMTKRKVKWVIGLAKFTYLGFFLSAMVIAFSMKLNAGDYTIQRLFSIGFMLFIMYFMMLFILSHLKNTVIPSKLNYQIQLIKEPELSEHLKSLFIAYAIDKDRFVLTKQKDTQEYYIYNHANSTLNKIENAHEMNKSRVETHSRRFLLFRKRK